MGSETETEVEDSDSDSTTDSDSDSDSTTDNDSTTESTTESTTDNDSPKLLTQSEVDAAIRKRLVRQENTINSGIAEQFGVKSVDEAVQSFKTLKQELDQLKNTTTDGDMNNDVNSTEIEELKRTNAELETKYKELVDGQEKARKATIIGKALSTSGVQEKYTSDAILLADAEGIDFSSAIKEDSTIDNDILKPLVDKLKEAKPYLFTPTPGTTSNRSGSGKTHDIDKEGQRYFHEKFGKW